MTIPSDTIAYQLIVDNPRVIAGPEIAQLEMELANIEVPDDLIGELHFEVDENGEFIDE